MERKHVYDIDKTSMYEGKMISVELHPAIPTRLNLESLVNKTSTMRENEKKPDDEPYDER